LVPEGAIEVSDWFVSDHSHDAALLREDWYRSLLARLERWVLPGIQLHYAARKALIEAQVRRALDGGARQVVVIGGGFDTLAYRLHRELPSARFFELDHPATSWSKRRSLSRHGSLQRNLSASPVDLTETPLPAALEQAGVSPALSSVVIVEGVLMYLPGETVATLVSAVDAYFRADLTLVTTFMVPDPQGQRRFHNGSPALSAWLRLVGEPFESAYSPADWVALLAERHLPVAELWDHEGMRRDVLPEPLRARPLAIGEQVCVARRR
jgi:methyltransferase (TIGR00027 family)